MNVQQRFASRTGMDVDRSMADWSKVAIVAVTVGVFAIAVGLSSPLLALVLKSRDSGSFLIGANAAMMPVGILSSAICVPRLAQRFGAYRVAIAFALLAAAAFAAMGLFRVLWVWFPARFGLGLAIGGFYIVNKAWLNEIAVPRYRGRIMGIYTAILAAGFSLGPFALALTGSSGWPPFVVGISALLASTLPIVFFAHRFPSFSVKERASVIRFIPLAPVLLVSVGMFGFFDHATLAFLPAYGMSRGLSEQTMALGLALLNLGNVFLQVPIGWLADRLSRKLVLIGCSVATIGGACVLPFVAQHGVLPLFALLFFWGACAYGVTTVSLAELGDRFTGSTLLAGSAAFTFGSGFGGMLGGPLTGAAIDIVGDDGLILTLAAGFGLLALLAAGLPLTAKSSHDKRHTLSRLWSGSSQKEARDASN
jgi:MFS family permease